MSSLVKFFDVFGTKFFFTIKQKDTFKTVPGGIFTFISFAIFVVLFIFLGKDFISKQNPNVFLTVNRTHTPESISPYENNLTIAYKIINKNIPIKPDELDMETFLKTTIFNNNQTHINTVNHTKCKDLPYDPHYNFTDDLYCISFNSNDTIGGLKVMNEYFSYFHLSTCDQISYHDDSSPKCTKHQVLHDKLKNAKQLNYYMHIYYPVLDYDSRNEKPVTIQYDYFQFFLDYNVRRQDFFYFQKTIIREDIGWLFEDFRESVYYTIEQRELSYSFVSDEKFHGSYDEIYQMRFEANNKILIYSRTYTKFQELLAIVMTLINLLMFIFDRLTGFFSSALLRNTICNQLFDWAPYKYSSLNPGSVINPNENLSRSIFVRSQNQNQILPASLNLDANKMNMGNVYVKPKKIRSCFVIKRAFGKCALSPSEKSLAEHYDEAVKIANEKLDLVNYFNMIYDLIAIKRTLMVKDGQPNLFNEVKKVSIYDKKELNLVFYYNKINKEHTIVSELDKSQKMPPISNKPSIINQS